MKKELPWYKCKPSERIKGAIQFCGYAAKGIFSDICDMYWLRECVMSKKELDKRFKEPELINELIDNEVIKIKGDRVVIEFLIEQYEKESGIKVAQSEGGEKGAKKRWDKPKAEPKPSEQPSGVKYFYIGTELIKQLPSEYIEESHKIKLETWCMQNGIDMKSIYPAFDKEYNTQAFNGLTHVVNGFKQMAKKSKTTTGDSPYTVDQITKAKNTLQSDGYLPDWFDKKHIHILK